MTDQFAPRVIHGSVHDGIATSTMSAFNGPLVGTLTLGVGTSDEPPVLRGITHLAEHMVFRVIDDTAPPSAGITSVHSLQFSVAGTPAEVADGLNQIAAVLAAPKFDPDGLDLERRVVRAESPWNGVHGAGLLTYRFGLSGVGNGHAGAPATSYLTTAELESWVSTWATRSNARLHFTGPVPAALGVRLPERPVPARQASEPLDAEPTLLASQKEGVALSLLVDTSLAPILRDVVIHDLMRELRHRRGLIYSIDPEITAIDEHRSQLDFVLDPVDEDVTRTTEHATIALQRIASEGVSDLALDATRTTWRTELETPSAWADYMDAWSAADVRGMRPPPQPPEALSKVAGVTTAELSAALSDSLATLFVAYDRSKELPQGLADRLGLKVDPFTFWHEASGPPSHGWRARSRGTGRGWRDLIGVAADSLWFRRETWTSVDLSQLVLVGLCPDGCLELLDHRGRASTFAPDDWRNGSAVRSAVLAATPETIQRDMTLFHD